MSADGGPVSRKEQALWLFQRLAPEATVDNLVFAVRTSATLDLARLVAAVGELLRRHPALRTIFPATRGVPVRRVLEADDVRPPVSTLVTTGGRLAETLRALGGPSFDLTTELPLRISLVTLAEGGSVVCLAVHHIAFDGRSAGIVLPELATIYMRQFPPAATTPRTPAPIGWTPSRDSLRYWVDALAGVDPAAQPLRQARPEPPTPTFAGARLDRDLAPGTRLALDTLRSRLRVTDNMVLLAAYLLLLARHGAGPDLVVAVPVDIRGRDDAASVGFGVNTIPLRVTVDLRAGFRQLATQVRERLAAGFAHADVSFESLLGELGLDTAKTWRAPLFRHMFSFLPPATVVPAGPLPDAEWVAVDRGTSRYDLRFVVLRWPDRFELQVEYATEIHDEAVVRALVERFELLLQAAVADPDRPVGELDLWHADEQATVARVNGDGLAWLAGRGPTTPLVPHRIADRAGRTPRRCAFLEDGRVVDHGDLAARAGTVRRELAATGVGSGDIVAVAAPLGADLASAVLAAWSLGAAYLPLDPAEPPERLRARLDTAGARAVVVGGDADAPAVAGTPVVRLPASWPGLTGDALADGLTAVRGDDRAYVIFTSGSTGEPKGVEITHAALANVVDFFGRYLAVTDDDRMLWLTSFGFDISALELFLPLCHGGGAVVAPAEARVRPGLLLDLVARHDVRILQTTPTIWRLVAGQLRDDELAGRQVLCGGEPLSAALADRLLRSGCRLHNVYGPTETTIWSTVAEIHPGQGDPVGIGTPVAATVVDVCDASGRPLPPGLVGELRIGGAGVARGYLGRPDLTAERFRDDAVLGRHYRTGDLATWRSDGTLELLGRADRQVKLRGRRIELGEVEAALERQPGVAAAAVVVRGDPQGDGRLIGYLQPRPAGDESRLRGEVSRHAAAVLPHYLVPADLVVVAALPRTSSGKVDYRALPDVPAGDAAAPAPATDGDPLVGSLLEIWTELLGQPDLDEHSNFFANGGQSLLAAVLTARVGELTGLDVSLSDVLAAPTPHELARLVGQVPDPGRAGDADGSRTSSNLPDATRRTTVAGRPK
jgi:amino acid adenylation domain-containing protein